MHCKKQEHAAASALKGPDPRTRPDRRQSPKSAAAFAFSPSDVHVDESRCNDPDLGREPGLLRRDPKPLEQMSLLR